jgi:hypothetical protein
LVFFVRVETSQQLATLRSLCPKITDMEPQFGSKPGASLSNEP